MVERLLWANFRSQEKKNGQIGFKLAGQTGNQSCRVFIFLSPPPRSSCCTWSRLQRDGERWTLWCLVLTHSQRVLPTCRTFEVRMPTTLLSKIENKILEVVWPLYITSLLIPHPQLCPVLAHLCPNAAVPNVQHSIHYSGISVLIDSDIKWINSTITQKSHSSPASLQKFRDSELLKTNKQKNPKPFHIPGSVHICQSTLGSLDLSAWFDCGFCSTASCAGTKHFSGAEAEANWEMNGSNGGGWRKKTAHWWIFFWTVLHIKKETSRVVGVFV